jgi:hypothetical protein
LLSGFSGKWRGPAATIVAHFGVLKFAMVLSKFLYRTLLKSSIGYQENICSIRFTKRNPQICSLQATLRNVLLPITTEGKREIDEIKRKKKMI